MPKYANLENILNDSNEIVDKTVTGVYDLLPTSWNNISNFHLFESDVDALKSFNWYVIVPDATIVDFDRYHIISETYVYDISSDTVHQKFKLQNTSERIKILHPNFYTSIDDLRAERTKRMHDFEWRYARYERQLRMGLSPTDDLARMDDYMQGLADITNQNLGVISWPEYISVDIGDL